jgi:hypothetical protein
LLKLEGFQTSQASERRFVRPDWSSQDEQWIEFTLAPNKEALPWP